MKIVELMSADFTLDTIGRGPSFKLRLPEMKWNLIHCNWVGCKAKGNKKIRMSGRRNYAPQNHHPGLLLNCE